MRDIKIWLYSLLSTDTQLQTLLGGTVTDKRIHESFPPEEGAGYYIVYTMLSGPDVIGGAEVQRSDLFFSMNIYGPTSATVDAIYTRIDDILYDRMNVILTNFRISSVRLGNINDIPDFDDSSKEKIYHKNFTIVMSGIYKA